MNDAVTDTHAVIWYLEDDARLGKNAGAHFDACDEGEIVLYVPIICLVEMVYLEERGSITAGLRQQLALELRGGQTGLRSADLTSEVVDALAGVPRADIPDMPDRIIAATAIALGLPLLTRDRRIQRCRVRTIW